MNHDTQLTIDLQSQIRKTHDQELTMCLVHHYHHASNKHRHCHRPNSIKFLTLDPTGDFAPTSGLGSVAADRRLRRASASVAIGRGLHRSSASEVAGRGRAEPCLCVRRTSPMWPLAGTVPAWLRACRPRLPGLHSPGREEQSS